MASQPFGGAEARENNQRHENNFYRRGVIEQSKEKTTHIFIGNPNEIINFIPELFEEMQRETQK